MRRRLGEMQERRRLGARSADRSEPVVLIVAVRGRQRVAPTGRLGFAKKIAVFAGDDTGLEPGRGTNVKSNVPLPGLRVAHDSTLRRRNRRSGGGDVGELFVLVGEFAAFQSSVERGSRNSP